MELKDNSYRCPWCGNFVGKATRSRYNSHSKECPYCHYNYICKLRMAPVIVMFLSSFAIFWGTAYAYLAFWLAYIYLCFDLTRAPMIRCVDRDRVMPTKGYNVKIELYPIYWKSTLKEDMIIPIVFIDDYGKAVSLPCCVRVEDCRRKKGFYECDLKLLEFGEKPENTSDRIYLYNMGKVIGIGDVVEELETSY